MGRSSKRLIIKFPCLKFALFPFKTKDYEQLAICNRTKYNKKGDIYGKNSKCICTCFEPAAYGSLTKEQFNAEIEKGMKDIKAGRVYSADEAEAEMKREFNI